MKLERKHVAALALIGVALALLAYRFSMKDEFDFYFGPGKEEVESTAPKTEPVGEEPETQQEIAKATSSRTPGSLTINGVQPSAVIESIRRARGARSASEAMDVVADMRRAGFQTAADDLEYQVNVLCVGHGELEPVFENTRWATEIVNEYCSSYDNSISLLEFNDITPPWTAGMEVLYNSFMLSTDKKNAENALVKLIVKAEAPEELDAFQGVLGRFRDSEQYVFDLGQGDDLGYTDPVELQVTALELFRCDRFGGCGAGGVIIAERCHLMGIGEPGWDLENYLRQTMSPFEFERVRRIRYFLNHFEG